MKSAMIGLGLLIALMLGAVALWAAAPPDPTTNPECKAGFIQIHDDDQYEYFTLVYRCPKRTA